MVQKTLPSTQPSTGRADADWQPFGLVAGPEGVQYGGGVSYVGARIARILPLKGKFGGFYWSTDQPIDVESQPNTSGNNRIDRLVLQYESGVGVSPAIIVGTASTTPAVPGVTQNLITEGNGIWQVPYAHWTVGRNSGPITDLVYEAGYPIRQTVPKSGDSGAGFTANQTTLIDTITVTPFQPRALLVAEVVVFIEAATTVGGAVTINGGGQSTRVPFGSSVATGAVSVPVTHEFPVSAAGPAAMNCVVNAEPNSGPFMVRRVAWTVREKAI